MKKGNIYDIYIYILVLFAEIGFYREREKWGVTEIEIIIIING